MKQPIFSVSPIRDEGGEAQRKHLNKDTQNSPAIRLRSEVNTLCFPLFFLSKRSSSQTIECRKMRRQGNQTVEAVWRVIPHPAYGRPGPLAHRIHRAEEQLITERGLPIENPVSFTIHNLCRRAGIAAGGTEYLKVKQALLSIKATQVESRGAFYAKSQRSFVDDVFSIYERIVFTGEQLPDGTIADSNRLWLGSRFLENLNSLYVKPLNYRFYLQLRTPIARRLYELLGVKFFGVAGNRQPWIRYRYSTLCELLPMTKHGYRSQMKQQLNTAHRELLEGGFLADVKLSAISQPRDWHIKYVAGERALKEISAVKTQSSKPTNNKKNWRASSGQPGFPPQREGGRTPSAAHSL